MGAIGLVKCSDYGADPLCSVIDDSNKLQAGLASLRIFGLCLPDVSGEHSVYSTSSTFSVSFNTASGSAMARKSIESLGKRRKERKCELSPHGSNHDLEVRSMLKPCI